MGSSGPIFRVVQTSLILDFNNFLSFEALITLAKDESGDEKRRGLQSHEENCNQKKKEF